MSESLAVSWNRIPGALRQITCKGSNVVGSNEGQAIYQRNYNDNSWTKLSGAAVWVAAGVDYSIWHCNAVGDIYRSKTAGGWDKMPAPGACVQIDAWTHDYAVCVNEKGELYEFQNGSWNRLAGTGTHITIGANGEKWHVNSDHAIYRMKPVENKWERISGSLKSIHCTDGNNVAGINAAGDLYRWNGSGWTQLPGNGTHIGITWGDMWHVNKNDAIWQAFI